jgi:ribosomal protein S1
VLEESRAEQRSEIVQNLEEGQTVEGMVKNITDYGAFVDLGGIDGLLHVTDMAWRRVNHPSENPVDRPDRQGPDHPHQPGHAPHLAGHEAA